MKLTRIFALSAILCAAQAGPAAAAETKGTLDVHAFGATGNGQTKDTAAFQKALDACKAAGGGMVAVPKGTYLVGSIVIGDNTTLHFEDGASLVGSPDVEDYPIVRLRWEGEFVQGHRALISATRASHIAVTGRGNISGPPLSVSRLRNPRGPVLIEAEDCTDVTLDGFTTQYQQLWSIHPAFCRKVVARNLTVRSTNVNGDGIDVDSCQDVLIENCDINSGDDAISLKSGRGMEAVRRAAPTRDVVIRDCTLVSSNFAALGIGTELSGGIQNVRLENCRISGRQNGIFLKSRDGRGGFIQNFTGENLTVQNSPTFLAINLLNKGIQASEPVTGDVEKWTQISNVRFDHIRVNNVSNLVLADRVPIERPLNGLALSDIQGTCRHALTLANMTNVVLAKIEVTGYQGALITQTNVQGSGLTQAN